MRGGNLRPAGRRRAWTCAQSHHAALQRLQERALGTPSSCGDRHCGSLRPSLQILPTNARTSHIDTESESDDGKCEASLG